MIALTMRHGRHSECYSPLGCIPIVRTVVGTGGLPSRLHCDIGDCVVYQMSLVTHL